MVQPFLIILSYAIHSGHLPSDWKERYQEESGLGIVMQPLIVVNFKTYSTAMGQKAIKLARAMERASTNNVRMVAVVSAFDLFAVKQAAPSLEVWSQHLDPVGQGSFIKLAAT